MKDKSKNRLRDNDCPVLTANQMRMADQYSVDVGHISASELMLHAGQVVADAVIRYAEDGGRIVVVTGFGNNAGDGFIAARLLRKKRIPVTVIPLVPLESLSDELLKELEFAEEVGVKVRSVISRDDLAVLDEWLRRAAVVVDAIFGTGLNKPLEGWIGEAVACINRSDRCVLAVDIASGIDADSGKVLGTAIKADFTLPIAAYKWGHWLNEGRTYRGELLSPAAIGIMDGTLDVMMDKHPFSAVRSYIINKNMLGRALPARGEDTHKKALGHLWVFGGSQGYTGAPRLTAAGAQAVGVGLVSIACPGDVYSIIAGSALEVMVHAQEEATIWHDANAVVAGPGWGRDYAGMLADLLHSSLAMVLDADALNMVSENSKLTEQLKRRDALIVMTPHPGEAGRLLGVSAAEVQKDRLATALALVDKYQGWVVLKGAQTLVVSPNHHVWLCPFGSANLAVAGTGDVLAGMIGGLLATGISPDVAIPAAVGLHAVAGEQSGWHRAGQLEEIVARLVQKFRG